MTAKEYLKQIKILDKQIDQKQAEFDSLKKSRTYIGGMDYSQERVQTSNNGLGFTGMSDKLTDLQREINEEIDRFYNMRHKRVNQIQQLSKVDYIDILFRRYVQYQSFEKIADKMDRSYPRICHIHGEALREFEEKFLKDSN